MKNKNTLNNSSLVDLDRLHLHKWSLPELWTEIGKQEKLKAAQEENIKKNGEFFSYLIILSIVVLTIVPIVLISRHKWNMWLLLPIYLFYLLIFFLSQSGSLKPENTIPPPPRLINRDCYSPEYYKMLKRWEKVRLEEECKKIAAEEDRKKLERIEQERLEEEERYIKKAIDKAAAELAKNQGKDVCMKCYIIEPNRCSHGYCRSCYDYCDICDYDDGGDDGDDDQNNNGYCEGNDEND